jgi:cytochrome P450
MVAPGFTPNTLEALIPRIRQRARVILDDIAGEGECEFVSRVAAELPIQMLAELFAVPQEDRHKLFHWSNLIIGGDDPDVSVSREQTLAAFMELAGYAMQLYEDRRRQPGPDLISLLANTEVEGQPMSVADYLSAFVLLVVAGNETTRNSISGGVLALSQFPAERRKLLDDPSLIPGAVDEIIRWVHPVIYMRRTALEDYELHGVRIKAGDKLALWYMSGNRDEDKWPDPFTFDVTRGGPRHLSFGYGQHLCIGWRLAEIQLTVLLEELLARYPDLEVVADVRRIRTNFLNSIKTMRVRYRPQTAAA